MKRDIIECIDHGVYGVSPDRCPLCPECDQPMWKGEGVTLQTVDNDWGPDLLRLVHTECVHDDEDDE